MSKNPNTSIKCSVASCSYHCDSQNYCTLNEIKVGCSDTAAIDCGATNCASTECASFQMGAGGSCCK